MYDPNVLKWTKELDEFEFKEQFIKPSPLGKVPSKARRMRGGMHGILRNVRRIGAGFPSSVTTLRWRQLPPGEALGAAAPLASPLGRGVPQGRRG